MCGLVSFSIQIPSEGRGELLTRIVVSENWDEDFLNDDADSEVIIPRAIEDAQASVVDHLSYVREFASLVEDLKSLRDRALSANIRHSRSKLLWDEAEGIIALATLQSTDETEACGELKEESRLSISLEETTKDLSLLRLPSHEKKPAPRRKSILNEEDNIFGPTPQPQTLQPLKVARSTTPSTTSSPPRLAVRRTQTTPTSTQTDAVETAKSLIRRMKIANGEGKVDVDFKGKVHFDTSMLGELVERVVGLIAELEEALGEKEREKEERRRGAEVKGKEVFDIEGRRVGCAL